MRWLNSFGFITILVFSFAFLTTMVLPAYEGNAKLARTYHHVQADDGQSPGRFRIYTGSQQGESNAPVYVVRGYRSLEHAYNP